MLTCLFCCKARLSLTRAIKAVVNLIEICVYSFLLNSSALTFLGFPISFFSLHHLFLVKLIIQLDIQHRGFMPHLLNGAYMGFFGFWSRLRKISVQWPTHTKLLTFFCNSSKCGYMVGVSVQASSQLA